MEILAAEAGGSAMGGDGYWRLALIIAAIGILGLYARWRQRRHTTPVDVKELRERDLNPNRYRDATDKALVELVEISRDINAQTDTKIRYLNKIIKDADQRISRLEELLATAKVATEAKREDNPTTTSGRTRKGTSSYSQRNGFRSEIQARIASLRDSGKNQAEIAKVTGLSSLEIQLALDQLAKESMASQGEG
jgi:hypothetical protein